MDDTKRLIEEIKKQLSEMSVDERKEIEKPKVFINNDFGMKLTEEMVFCRFIPWGLIYWKRRGRAASSDGGQPHPGRREAVLIRGKSQAENLRIFTTNPSRFFAVTPDLQHLCNKKSNDGTS